MKFIKDTNIKPVGTIKTNRLYAMFKCPKCNQIVERPKRQGINAKSCGCKTKYKNQIINNFLILDDEVQGRDRRLFLVRCLKCSSEKEILAQSIINNKIVSCGCARRERNKTIQTTHGESYSRLYLILRGMINRCNNPKSDNYKNYGERGVTICSEWKNDFITFQKWALNNGYKDTLSIDRIDPKGNYEPSNCRWTIQTIQSRNTRKVQRNNTSGYKGVSLTKNKQRFISKLTVNYKTIRLGTFDTALDASNARDAYIVANKLEHTLNNEEFLND